ncbi:MAG: formylglycine-generating enzyme family protein [Alphaproteobacteria bacterium]
MTLAESMKRRFKHGGSDSFKDIDIAPEMVIVPAGDFIMGSPEDEIERTSDESPQHKVTIAQAFAVGRYVMTFAEWDAAQEDKDWERITGLAPYRPTDRGWGRGEQPLINVSWHDAQGYVKWLREKTGQPYRLLSEAEWEYVCRAGTSTAYWWGDALTEEQANYGLVRRTVPVDSYQPNPWGLYQVHGNVWEWVEDCWNDNYDGAPQDGSARTTGECDRRILRGGSWFNAPWHLRSATRYGNTSALRFFNAGFRVARTLTEQF